ncbi:MAG: serine hydrolase domain-containing protein [Bacteroidota bacterium]
MQYLLPVVFLLPFLAHRCCAQQSYFTIEKDGQTYSLNQQMNEQGVNGAAQVIIRNFEIDTTIYLGYADKQKNKSVNKHTLFQMGSMTTPITKFAVVKLISEGKIELDAPVNQYLKDWQIPTKKFTQDRPVTVRDLLLKQRGFNEVYKPKGYVAGSALPSWEQIMGGKKPSNIPAMHLKKDSSGDNSSIAADLILQRLLEDIHGRTFANIIETEVFLPLEMTHSIIAAELTNDQKVNAAVGYEEDNRPVKGGAYVFPELAVSGLWSTPVDYAKFVLHVFKAAKGIDNSMITQSLAQQSVTAQRDYYSLIFHHDDNVYWGGAPKGFYSQFAGHAEKGWIVVGCTNRELGWQFVNRTLNPIGIKYAQRN